jgi:hypothetical protein
MATSEAHAALVDHMYAMTRRHATLTGRDVARLAMRCADVMVVDADLAEVVAVTAELDEHTPVISLVPRHGRGPAVTLDVDPAHTLRQAHAGEYPAWLALGAVHSVAAGAVAELRAHYRPHVRALIRLRRMVTGDQTPEEATR